MIPEEDDSWLDNIALTIYLLPDGASLNITNTPPSAANAMSPQDKVMHEIFRFLTTLETPSHITSSQDKRRFITKATRFFVKASVLFRRNGQKPPLKAILDPQQRRRILEAAHEKLGHRGEQAVLYVIKERFYWPSMWNDVRHHIRSCHQCQIRSTFRQHLPLQIAAPAKVFAHIYLDCMYMPLAKGYRYIIAARDDLSGAAEGKALRALTAKAVAQFFWEQILCRYGAVQEVTTDNGPEVKSAFAKLMDRYGIPHIKISPYNSRANGVVERGHYTIREALIKTCGDNVKKWPDYVPHAFFADRVTIRRQTGFSPYYLLHGQDPLLPFDLAEASFMSDEFHSGMSTTDLLAARIQQLQKRQTDIDKAAATLKANRLRSKAQFEKRFRTRLRDQVYPPGTLVLVRNTAVEKELDRKSKPRYLGPYEVHTVHRGGRSYKLKELDGAIWEQSIAAFRVIPYIPRNDPRLRALNRTSESETEESSDEDNQAGYSTDEQSD